MQANRTYGDEATTVTVPAQHVPTLRHAALRISGITAEVLRRRIEAFDGASSTLMPATAKGRLDEFWSLFIALDDPVPEPADDVELPVTHAWAIREAIDYHAEHLRDRALERLENHELITLGRELEALHAYREQIDPLAGRPDEVFA